MTGKDTNIPRNGSSPGRLPNEQPLLRALVAEANRRGETLATLAKTLGVTYERLAQWRRNEAAIGNAHRSVHELAAQYLGIPTVLVLVMSGTIGLKEFVWPNKGSLNDRVSRDLERLRQDPFIGPFVPSELATAAPAVKHFVAFLFHELGDDSGHQKPAYRWLTALHQAAVGNTHGQLELEALRKDAIERQDIF